MGGGDPGAVSPEGLRSLGARRPLPRARLRARAPESAERLLGALLVRREGDGTESVARLVEVEAYREDDPASHSFRGRTERTEAMFARPGAAYVYRSYGVHWCLNVTCEPSGTGAAVLLRAAVALTNEPLLHRRRGRDVPDHGLLRGPGVLTRTMAVDDRLYGADLCAPDGSLRLETDGWRPPPQAVIRGPRVGIRRAADRPWRLYLREVPEVSAYRRHEHAGEDP